MSLCEKNRPKCGPTQFFVKINRYIAFAGEKSNPDIWVSFVIFAKLPIHSKSPFGRKFAQSGHPDFEIKKKTSLENFLAAKIGRFLRQKNFLQLKRPIIQLRTLDHHPRF
jgi:hypothetical protein